MQAEGEQRAAPGEPPYRSALIIAGAAAKGAFAAGALQAIADRLHRRFGGGSDVDAFELRVIAGTSSGALNAAVFAAGLRAGQARAAADSLVDLWANRATWDRITFQESRIKIVYDALAPFMNLAPKCDVQLRMVASPLGGITPPTDGDCPDVGRYTTYEQEFEYGTADFARSDKLWEIARVSIASAAIPVVFAPVSLQGRKYADGGIVDDAPIGWALGADSSVDHLLVVTSDPARLDPPKHVGRFPVELVLRAFIQERLTRDIQTAQSFNCEIRELARQFGIPFSAIEDRLGWKLLDILEIRPDEDTPGDAVSGFLPLHAKERERNIAAGRRAGEKLDLWIRKKQGGAGRAAAPPAAVPLPASPYAPTDQAKSKHLQKSCELLLIAPLRQGPVDAPATVPGSLSYAARLKLLLGTLFGLRQAGIERLPFADQFVGPLEGVGTLHFVQWAILDGDGACEGGQKLLLAVTFDGPWESYIQGVVDRAGSFLDTILCHCEGYSNDGARNATADGYDAFAKWVRAHQVSAEFFHSGEPGLSTIDLRYLKAVENVAALGAGTRLSPQLARLSVPIPEQPADLPVPPAVSDGMVQDAFEAALAAFFLLASHYPAGSRDNVFFLRIVVLELDLITTHFRRENKQPDPPKMPEPNPAWLWYQGLKEAQQKEVALERAAAAPARVVVPFDQVQGNILNSYDKLHRGRLVFFQFTSPAGGAQLLERLARDVTTEKDDRRAGRAQRALNIAVTFNGLQSLGVPPPALAQFPEEFREGMQERAPTLGDVGASHPANWLPPIAAVDPGSEKEPRRIELSTVDAVVILQSKEGDEEWLATQVDGLKKQPGVMVVAVQKLHREDQGEGGTFRELFGFRDGLSQPVVDAQDVSQKGWIDRVATGEILLGYDNAYRRNPYGANALFENGSFMAMRKFEQDVDGFRAFIDRSTATAARSLADPDAGARSSAEVLKAKIMGRYADGVPLARGSNPDPGDNSFTYGDDPVGAGCPFSAHVRRANPRRTEKGDDGVTRHVTPRIVRRGVSFGKDCCEGVEAPYVGLVFMAYCASLGNQYEVVQQWVNGGDSTGTFGAQVDPLFAIPGRSLPSYTFLQPGHGPDGVVQLQQPLQRLVKLHWGLYLFVPSIRALGVLVDCAKQAAEAKGEDSMQARRCPFVSPPMKAGSVLDCLQPPDPTAEQRQQARDALELKWQRILEDFDQDAKMQAASLWKSLRLRGGHHQSPYGTLVSTVDDVANVFINPEGRYSVSPYGDRMRKSLGGPLYLGLDLGTGHDALAARPNEIIKGIARGAAFAHAYESAQALLGAFAPRAHVDLHGWFVAVLYEVVKKWFGAPESQEQMSPLAVPLGPTWPVACMGDFILIAKDIFDPRPMPMLTGAAALRGEFVQKVAATFAEARMRACPRDGAKVAGEPLIDTLAREGYDGGNAVSLALAWMGAVLGLAAPTSGTFDSILMGWLSTRAFWRLQEVVRAEPREAVPGIVAQAVMESMQCAPMPFLLHRRDTRAAVDDDAVVLGLASAGAQLAESGGPPDPSVLFGYAPGWKQATHSCPGNEMALGILVAATLALLQRSNVRFEMAPLTISYGA